MPALSPLLVIPYTRNLIVNSKFLLILIVLFIILISFAIKTLVQKRWEVAISPLTLPLILFGLAVVFSTFLTGSYPVENLLGFGGIYLSLVLISLLGSTLIKGDYTLKIIRALTWGGALLSLSMFLQHFGWGPTKLINASSNFNLPHSLIFNLAGSSFVAIQVMFLALVGFIGLIASKKKLAIQDWLLGAINLAGMGLGVWSILPGRVAAFTLTSFTASWTVMLRSLESWQTALIGHGPAAYANAYARFKPLWTNGQAYWQFNFSNANMTPLTLVVTLGLVGLFAWLFLFVQVIGQLKTTSKDSQPLLWLLIASFVLQLLLPSNLVILAIQISLLVFWVAANQNHFSLLRFRTVRWRLYPAKLEFIKKLTKKGNWFVQISGVLLFLVAGGLIYGLGRAYAAYYYIYQADLELAAGRGVQVYENQRRAVTANPYLDNLRRDYALTNLQLAVALSNNLDLSEAERQQVTQLINQAIREGRAATLLDPNDIDNWLTLAEVYRNLIGAADEAGTWTVNTLVNAVQVNPVNPIIRLQLGQLALLDEKPQDASSFFLQAIELKPNLPAAYYQLGVAFQQLGQLENARTAWQEALRILPETSDDYLTLSQQLEDLEETLLANPPTTTEVDEQENTTPNVTEQNVSQQENDVVKPGEDAQLN